MTKLNDFWPSSEGVDAIPLDAAAFERDLFLALHQPMVFSLRNEGTTEARQQTEEQFLSVFLKEQGSGVTISVIEGQSGVGKSHAIRWLEARISDDDRYVVIWVPRNRSAKWVLNEILRRPEFQSDEFREIRTRLSEAVEPIGVVEAGWNLRVKLVLALQQEPPPGLSREERRFFVDLAGELAEFVSDPNIWRLPPPTAAADVDAAANPLLRLARHLVGENLKTKGVEDRLFVEGDLELLPADVQRAGPAARAFWEEVIRPNTVLEDGKTSVRNATTGLLNRLLDEARAAVLGLDRAPIADLFVDLRRRLQQDRKELVLLIEDFTVMAGLQRSLLDIMVKTAATADGDTICPIRTALALTPGFMHGEALPTNVRNRANMYTMEERIDEEETLARYEALAGSFLNVARLTRAGIATAGSGASFDDVAQPLDEGLEAILSDFGRSSGSGQWLFPFNRDAIRTLARQHVVKDSQLIYNPRIFMRNVMVRVLEQRSEFIAGDFPNSASGLPDRLSPGVQQELGSRVSASDMGTYRRVLATWGGKVTNWEQACRVPPGIFEAFGLASLEGAVPDLELPGPEPPRPTPSPSPEVLPAYHHKLEAWLAGETDLSQEVARDLRKSVVDLVTARLPHGWPGLPGHAPSSLPTPSVYVPKAKGNRQLTPETAFVNFSTKNELDSRHTGALYHLQAEALLQWNDLPEKTPTPELFEVVSRASAFTRRVQSDASAWLAEHPVSPKTKTDGKAVQSWISAQLTLAEANGEGCPKDPGKRLQRLFPDEPRVSKAAPEEWKELVGSLCEVSGATKAAAARSGLLAVFGAFQGTGTTPAAVDTAALWDLIRRAPLPMPDADVMREGLGPMGTTLVKNSRAVTRMAEQRVKAECASLEAWMGEHGAGTISKALMDLAHTSRNSNVAKLEAEALIDALTDFDTMPGRATATLIQRIANGIEESNLISTLGKLDWGVYAKYRELQQLSEALLTAVEASQEYLAATGHTMDHSHIGTEFRATLDYLSDTLDQAGV